MSAQTGVYVFCAIREREPKQFGKVMLNGQENIVYTIHYENVAILVSKVKGEVLPERNNLLIHQEINSKVMRDYSVIPFSFGNVFHSEEDILLITKHMHGEFEKLFSEIENKLEVGLKVIAKKEWIEEEMKKDLVLSEWKDDKKASSDPGTFYDQIRVGELAQNFVFRLQQEVENEIYHPLLEIAEAGKQNKTIPGKILLNAAYLIDCKNELDFDQRVNDLFEIWKERVEFKYTGPWPPYNFINIRLKIEGNS